MFSDCWIKLVRLLRNIPLLCLIYIKGSDRLFKNGAISTFIYFPFTLFKFILATGLIKVLTLRLVKFLFNSYFNLRVKLR